jgi:hypothetical protein
MLLTPQDVALLFKLHRALMFFVNKRLKVLPGDVASPDHFSSLPPQVRLKVRDAFLNPMVWTLQVNGFMVDVRHAPREVQEIAFNKGLIPYIAFQCFVEECSFHLIDQGCKAVRDESVGPAGSHLRAGGAGGGRGVRPHAKCPVEARERGLVQRGPCRRYCVARCLTLTTALVQ